MRTVQFFVSLAAVTGLALAAAPAAAPQPAGDPAAFMSRVLRLVAANQYERVWADLHPAHKLVAPLQEYVQCESLSPIPGRLVSLRVLSVVPVRVQVAGVAGTVPGRGVKIRLAIGGAPMSRPVVVMATYNAVVVGGRWRWILPPERYQLYASDGCTPVANG